MLQNPPAHTKNNSNSFIRPEEEKKYIYFSVFTKSESGRHVKIKSDLMLPFLYAVKPGTHEGDSTIHQIENLKQTAGILNNSQNACNAFDHMIKIMNLQVFYRVESGCVYITNLKVVHKGDKSEAGLYQVTEQYGKTRTSKIKNDRLIADDRREQVFINGTVTSLDTAADAALEQHNDEKSRLCLFYNPSAIVNELGMWKSKSQSKLSRTAASKLSKVLMQNKKTTWNVEGEGAALLNEALKSVTSDLNKQTFRLINPVADTPELITRLVDKKAKHSSEAVSLTNQSRSANIAMMTHSDKLAESIGSIPEKKLQIEDARDVIQDKINNNATISKGMAPLPGGFKTFIDIARQANKLI